MNEEVHKEVDQGEKTETVIEVEEDVLRLRIM